MVEAPTTNLRLLASFDHVEFPASVAPDDWKEPYREPLGFALQNLINVISFGTKMMKDLPQSDARYEAICQARAEASEAYQTAQAVKRAETFEDFNKQVSKLREQYATLVASVKHYFYLADKALWPLVDETM